MRRTASAICLAALGLGAAAVRSPATAQQEPALLGRSVSGFDRGATSQSAESFSATVTKRVSANYLLHLPAGYDAGEAAWPLVVFLHGAGERGDSLALVTRHGPPKLVEAGRAPPAIIASPQSSAGVVWSVDLVLALIDEVVRLYRVDEDRIYLTGLSMGGFGAWEVGMADPDRFAAIIPISGGGNPVGVCRLKDTPVWALHGARDEVIPAIWSEELARRLEACGGDVRLTIYADLGHDAWTATYEDPAVWEWLLSQRRPRIRRRRSRSVPEKRPPAPAKNGPAT